jgi:hypothetical protein
MVGLSVDYARLVRDLGVPRTATKVGQRLMQAVAHRYETECGSCSLLQFEQSGATYLFDFASAVGAVQEDRTVAAWAVTPASVRTRDVAYQRNFPLPPDPDGTPVDRGHLIPHLSGGQFGPNIFPQCRALNRGWSEQGRRYRALERRPTSPMSALGRDELRHCLRLLNAGDPVLTHVGGLQRWKLQAGAAGGPESMEMVIRFPALVYVDAGRVDRIWRLYEVQAAFGRPCQSRHIDHRGEIPVTVGRFEMKCSGNDDHEASWKYRLPAARHYR